METTRNNQVSTHILADFLDHIYTEHSEQIDHLRNNANGLELIIDGFLSSEIYSILAPEDKIKALYLVRRTKTLIDDLENFQQENKLGIYAQL